MSRLTPCLLLTAFLAGPAPADDSAPPRPSGDVAAKVLAKAREVPKRFDQPDLAAEYYLRQRVPKGRTVDAAKLYEKALAHMEAMPRYSTRLGRELPSRLPLKAELGTWEELGPGNVGGRTRALLIHPGNPEVLYAAGVSGGIWKSVDGGRRWRPLADLLPNIAVNSLAMDPSDPAVIYAGTGEGYFREVIRETSLPLRGAGIWKTTDAGRTWKRLARGPDFAWVNDLAVSHGDPRRVYAATRTGVWRSLDGGETWTRILRPTSSGTFGGSGGTATVLGGCLDLEMRADRPGDILLAACGTFERATVYRNPRAQVAGAAAEWTGVLTEEGMGRTLLALAPSNQGVVYALSVSYVDGPDGNFNGGLHAVFRSDDAGGSWRAVVRNSDADKLSTLLLTNPVIANLVACDFGENDSYSNLGWHAAALAVDPVDPDVVFAGGVDLFRSDDGGQSWGTLSYWHASPPSAHADHHAIAFHPGYDGAANQTMLVGNDGGVWKTRNARARKGTGERATCGPEASSVVWESKNASYGVTQFYHGAAFPTARRYFGGTQDNGTQLGSESLGRDGWLHVHGGDGGYVAIDPTNPRILYAESQGLGFVKSTDGGRDFEPASAGITDTSVGRDEILFIAPFTMDPSNPRRLWLGARHAWRTVNGAASWTAASPSWPSRVSAVAVAPSDPDRVVVGHEDGTIRTTGRALTADASTVWGEARPRAGFVSWVTFDPGDARRVYATYATFGGQHVWASDDGGATWRPIDGTGRGRLPNLPTHAVLVDPHDGERIFLGTDLGVFVSTSRGGRWTIERTGFAHVVTESLDVVTLGGTSYLFAFTHGRGAWRVEMGRD